MKSGLRVSNHVEAKLLLIAFALILITLNAPVASAQTLTGYPDTLLFFKNYFVTGDYVVNGVGLKGQGDASGFATGYIPINGIPSNAVVVGAFLYWEAIEATATPSTMDGYFQGYPIVGVQPAPLSNTPPCWSSGGGTGSSNGSKHLRVYRADVAPYLVVNGQYQTNTPAGSLGYQVRLRDSGSNGAGAPLTEGASLVIIYRTLTDTLRSVVLYDGAWTMNNATSYMSQTIRWFYQASGGPAKLTHIVGDGQANFGEAETFFGGSGGTQTVQNPFNGAAGNSWDNETFPVTVAPGASQVATDVLPNSSNIDCLSWGAVVFSTPVVDTDGDGLLDIWEDNKGYIDSKDGTTRIDLPGADSNVKDLFVQIDYMKNSGATSGPQHSHLPRLDALSSIANAFSTAGIHVHFDVGNNYQGNAFIVPSAKAHGGNPLDEDAVSCTDNGTTLCAFDYPTVKIPGIVSWKTGVTFAKNQFFQHGRKDSYRYVFVGHALGLTNLNWAIVDQSLTSIMVDALQKATITTSTPHGLLPGARVSIGGAFGDFNLNGNYNVESVLSSTTFTVQTSGVMAATFGYFPNQALGFVTTNGVTQINEPNLGVSAGAPISTSGFSDLGGGDSLVTLGLWRADDASNCQKDPAGPLAAGQVFCDDQVGNTTVQAGTIMHEMGHTLFLTHGGYYPGPQPAFGQNCKPNFQSVMNYLFQIRGLPNPTTLGGPVSIDYSGRTLSDLGESNLVEADGLVTTVGAPLPLYGTRWYGPPTFLDTATQNSVGGRYAASHCDGTPVAAGEPPAVRITGVTLGSAGARAPIDWNNNGVFINIVSDQDLNFDGNPDSVASDGGLTGFNDWANLYLRQIGARRNIDGFSVDIGAADIAGGGTKIIGGGTKIIGGGSDLINAGSQILGAGTKIIGGGTKIIGGGTKIIGGGEELDFDAANTSVEAPVGLTATLVPTGVQLNWNPPSFGQIRTYYIWRANTTKVPLSATNLPVLVGTNTGTPLNKFFIDTGVKKNQTYAYFVTAALGTDSGPNSGNQSGGSNIVPITVK
jgi:hypothetical protein